MSEEPSDLADRSITGYANSYRRRQTQRDWDPFGSREQNALLALFWTRSLNEQSGSTARIDSTDYVSRLVDTVFRGASKHDIGIDIAGYVTVDGFGTLAMADAPCRAAELTLESGGGAGAVRGLYGVGWRLLFLVAAWPYLDWRHRRRAATEIDRRQSYLAERIGPEVTSFDSLTLSQSSRILWLAAEVGRRLSDERLLAHATAQIDRLAEAQREDGSLPVGPGQPAAPSAHLAQFILAAAAVGRAEVGGRVANYLFAARSMADGDLLSAAESGDRPETSPWIPLGLLAASGLRVGADEAPSIPVAAQAAGVRGWLRKARPSDRV